MLKGSQARKKATIKAMQAFAIIVAAHLLSTAGVGAQAASKTSTAKSSNASPTTPAESGPCQIGVIPIAGDLFMIKNFGPLEFLDKYSRASVTTWALDDLVVSRVRAAAPGRSVRRISYTREELKSGGRREQNPFFYRAERDIADFVRFLAPRLRCERYVVVHRHGGTHREYGIGISRYPYDGSVHLYAIMYIRVYDGGTFTLIKEAQALMTDDTYVDRLLRNPLGGPSRELDRTMFPEKPADVANNPVLRDGVRAMLTASLDKTLPPLLRH
ncbi:hypothetical protein CT676_05015 [Bradyrhizobium sp. MOS001]|uniref:hypothetical protein n=1 Tax=unclassified Bradyrhizobium TaxID=2631580 RepID=UPI0010754A54|nr:hypothetical protein [Bradyrhizobium sp. MOS001]TFW62400.1 hypothetical protein CT676_05015 [Bradyrhizobium sp. MOS001]